MAWFVLENLKAIMPQYRQTESGRKSFFEKKDVSVGKHNTRNDGKCDKLVKVTRKRCNENLVEFTDF